MNRLLLKFKKKSTSEKVTYTLYFLFFVLMAIIYLMPIMITFFNSFRTLSDYTSETRRWYELPAPFQFYSWKNIFADFKYKTYTFGTSKSYAEVDVPARFEYSFQNGIYWLQDTEASAVVTIDFYSDDMLYGASIADVFTASEVEQLFKDNFAQTDTNLVITSIKASRADFGSIPAYRCRTVTNYNGVTVYSYSYLFIHDINLFEITVASQDDDALTRSIVNSVRALGNYTSSKV